VNNPSPAQSGGPQHLFDFRPIFCAGCVYKVLAKVLANRLKMVIDMVILENQYAFVKGIHVLEGIIIAN